jgi:hypothetical protein
VIANVKIATTIMKMEEVKTAYNDSFYGLVCLLVYKLISIRVFCLKV